MKQLILASASPRRRELLALITPDFVVETSQVEESAIRAATPQQLVQKLARCKCLAVAQKHPEAVVIGSDTVVDCGGVVLGKPRDKAEALHMLTLLSGRAHQVHTGVCIAGGGQERCFVSTAQVHFAPIPSPEMEAYADTEEPYDKAGAYAIQGKAAIWCEKIDGDYYTIMGFPVHKVAQELRRFL